jgi:hypothetical protein
MWRTENDRLAHEGHRPGAVEDMGKVPFNHSAKVKSGGRLGIRR